MGPRQVSPIYLLWVVIGGYDFLLELHAHQPGVLTKPWFLFSYELLPSFEDLYLTGKSPLFYQLLHLMVGVLG